MKNDRILIQIIKMILEFFDKHIYQSGVIILAFSIGFCASMIILAIKFQF